MPASEQTWRNQRTLHVVFGASAVVMAIATLMMMARDHNREWKDWTLKDRKKDAWMIQSRRDAAAQQYAKLMNAYEDELRDYDSQAIPQDLVKQFEELVKQEDERLKTAPVSTRPTPEEKAAEGATDTKDGEKKADAPAAVPAATPGATPPGVNPGVVDPAKAATTPPAPTGAPTDPAKAAAPKDAPAAAPKTP